MAPRTTPNDVRDVMTVSETDVSDAQLETPIREAHTIVERRLDYDDEELLTDIETRVAAHFALPHVTGGSKGRQIESIRQSSATLKFSGPDGNASVHWERAVLLSDGDLGTGNGRARNPTVDVRK